MNSTDFNEYAELAGTGFSSSEPVKPEDEFFHALYISGNTRKNHINISEEAGKMQIRGVQYNLESVNMVITHVKRVLVKNEKMPNNKTKVACFSFKESEKPPWKGWNDRPCGSNSSERAASQFCSECREQIIVSGIFVDQGGNPVPHAETGKPIFIFFRAKGMKYKNASEYLGECFKMEIKTPLFEPVTDETLKFEKSMVNNKRHVTTITMGTTPSNFGDKAVFVFTKGTPLDNQSIFNVLGITKKSYGKFKEKFDWSKAPTESTTNYAPEQNPQQQVSNENVIPDSNVSQTTQQQQPQTEAPKPQPTFNFDEIEF